MTTPLLDHERANSLAPEHSPTIEKGTLPTWLQYDKMQMHTQHL